jgi:DNA-binding CsgD family transcriptional regulator
MSVLKSIIIGCDDTVSLAAVLNNVKETEHYSHTIISAARISDFFGIVKSMDADLIILCFRNNQLALNDINYFVNKPEIPILILTRTLEAEKLQWNYGNIVFTYPMEHVGKGDFLTPRIHSIFLMNYAATKKNTENSLVEKTIQPDHKTENLSRYVLELDQKVEVLMKVKERILDLYSAVGDSTRNELISIVNSIKLCANDNKLWDDFKLYFERTNPKFLLSLARKHPELTPKDLKYCCYLKLNMTNDDIRNLLGINQESVRTHKYRLKKKMELPRDLDLVTYLRNVLQE